MAPEISSGRLRLHKISLHKLFALKYFKSWKYFLIFKQSQKATNIAPPFFIWFGFKKSPPWDGVRFIWIIILIRWNTQLQRRAFYFGNFEFWSKDEKECNLLCETISSKRLWNTTVGAFVKIKSIDKRAKMYSSKTFFDRCFAKETSR